MSAKIVISESSGPAFSGALVVVSPSLVVFSAALVVVVLPEPPLDCLVVVVVAGAATVIVTVLVWPEISSSSYVAISVARMVITAVPALFAETLIVAELLSRKFSPLTDAVATLLLEDETLNAPAALDADTVNDALSPGLRLIEPVDTAIPPAANALIEKTQSRRATAVKTDNTFFICSTVLISL